MANAAPRLELPPASRVVPPRAQPLPGKGALRMLRNLRAGILAAGTIVLGWGLARPRPERSR